MSALRSLTAAFGYFSTLPVGRLAAYSTPDAHVLSYLPVVGIALGAIVGCAAFAVGYVAPHAIVVAVAFGGMLAITGALHVDGLLDCADALFASVPPARRLDILKDPRAGTFGIATFAAVGVLWLAALWITPRAAVPATLAFAAGTARYAAIVNAFIYPHARGVAAPAFARRPSRRVLGVSLAALIALSFALGPWAWLAIPGATALGVALAAWCASRLGGLVGDVYGALIVLLEVALITGLALLARQ